MSDNIIIILRAAVWTEISLRIKSVEIKSLIN